MDVVTIVLFRAQTHDKYANQVADSWPIFKGFTFLALLLYSLRAYELD
jgi:hypothetical protein